MLSATLTWHGLTFHLYGLILGLALVVWYLLFQRQAQLYHIDNRTRLVAVTTLLVGALVGARLWHVATDWWFYQSQLNQIFYLWQGGLSILGAIWGGVGGLLLLSLFHHQPKASLGHCLAACALALPLAQAIGRLGNYLNQELYGYPTTLAWGITIDSAHRLPQFMANTRFHPLFAYEILILIGLFGLLKLVSPRQFWFNRPVRLFGLYLAVYSGIRFGLDFLRPDKATWSNWPLGINQTVCLVVLILSSLWLVTQFNQYRQVIRAD